jgi:hypothetical protein
MYYIIICVALQTMDVGDISNIDEDISIGHHIVKDFMQDGHWYGNVSNL